MRRSTPPLAKLLEAAGVVEPPVDAVAMAQRHLGMAVCLDHKLTEEQRQRTVAHKIGEHLKADLLRRLGIDPSEPRAMAGESLANRFAERLLVPTGWLAEQARLGGFDLFALKRIFRTASHEVIAWRLLDLPEPSIITVVDNEQVSRRRGNTCRPPRDLSDAERHCLTQVQRYSRPCAVNADGWHVQGWPIHQVDWKREILRSQVDE
ncbi:MAG: hypothetical protein U0736_23775 [Gemmataceae bacterium]